MDKQRETHEQNTDNNYPINHGEQYRSGMGCSRAMIAGAY
jgi:hypothetical protein